MISRPRLGCSCLLVLSALGAGEPPPKGYVCGRAAAPPVIDGRLDDESWKPAPWTDDFVDIEGDAKPKPRFRTRVKMVWDDAFLYIAAELEEPHVWGKMTRHDSVIFQDNDFEVFIDPDGDNHEYYEIEINALNTEWDLLLEKPYRDGGPAVDAWEVPGLKTATFVDGRINDPSDVDRSWSVELAIPWKVLAERAHRPSPPVDGDQWRINFSRVEWEHRLEGREYRKVEGKREANWVWSPQGAIDMHRPERWGYVQFSTLPPARAPFRPDPTGPIRDRLMEIYRAERAFHARTNSWAGSVDALGLPGAPSLPAGMEATIRSSPGGFEASMNLMADHGRPAQVLTIRQDSRLSQVDKKP